MLIPQDRLIFRRSSSAVSAENISLSFSSERLLSSVIEPGTQTRLYCYYMARRARFKAARQEYTAAARDTLRAANFS